MNGRAGFFLPETECPGSDGRGIIRSIEKAGVEFEGSLVLRSFNCGEWYSFLVASSYFLNTAG